MLGGDHGDVVELSELLARASEAIVGGQRGSDSKRGGVALPTKVFATCLLLDYPDAPKCWKLMETIQEPT